MKFSGMLDTDGFDIARLSSATDRPRILFVTNQVLGWRTFGEELERATRGRDDIYAAHIRFRGSSSLVKRGARRFVPPGSARDHAHGALVRDWARQLHACFDDRMAGAFDVVHVSPHLLALGIVRSTWRGPLSVIFDADVRQAKVQRQRMPLATVERNYHALLQDEAEIVRRADQLWSMSHWAASSMAAAYGVDVESIGIVPPVRAVASRSWNVTSGPGPVRMAFVGNDLARKGGDRLLRWHQERWVGRVELHIFTAARRPRGTLPGVVWHRRVDNRELVSQHLKSMDCFVLPTTSDMSPFAVSEAVAAGLPVVASAIGGIGEMVENGVTGFLVDPADDLAFIATVERLFDPDLRRRMGEASLAAACTSLNADIVMRKFIDRIRDLAT